MRVLAVSLILLLPICSLAQERRAQSLIEKNKRFDAYELLLKSVSKDSLASSEHFILASLFIDMAFEYYNIDSAYNHVITARENFGKLDNKLQDRLTSNGYSLQIYDTLKKYIETAAFRRASNLGREEDFITFLALFPESEQADSAVILRDAEAFIKASERNTYQEYQRFFEKYPEAINTPEAKKRYHRLLFQDKTASGKLAAYKQFLLDYPDTWHRRETEWQIFRIMTGQNTINAYRQFIKEYPKSYLVEKARGFAFNLADAPQRNVLLDELKFSPSKRDSIQFLAESANDLLLLSHSGTAFEIVKADGSRVLESLSKLANRNKCEEIGRLVLLLAPDANRLVSLAGEEIKSGDFWDFSMIAPGFLELISSRGTEIVHLDGSKTTGQVYSSVMMISGFITYIEDNLWGIESITGIPMVKPQFDTLFQFNDHLIIMKDGQWGTRRVEDLFPLLDQEEVSFDYVYDSAAIVRNNELFVQVDDKRGLLNHNLEIVVPLGEPNIELLEDGYFLDSGDSILDSRLANVWYSDIRRNEEWTIGIRLASQDLYYRGKKIAAVEEAELLGRSAVIVSREGKKYCYFEPTTKIEIKAGDQIKPVRKMGENSVVRHYLYTDQRKRQSVIDQYGKRLKMPRFDRLIDLGEDYMIFSIKGYVYNVLDNKGKVILKDVEAATSLDSGYISYLAKGKFGLLNIRNETMIEAKYDKPLRRYNNRLFLIEEGGKLGLINRHDSLFLAPKYEDIQSLNDSIAVLKANFRWSFWNLYQGRLMLDNVSDYWEYSTDAGVFYKIFKGLGYGIWQPQKGMLLNSTYDELEIKAKNEAIVFITEKWVEEADLVILLYYDARGELLRKSVLTTKQYESLQCPPEY